MTTFRFLAVCALVLGAAFAFFAHKGDRTCRYCHTRFMSPPERMAHERRAHIHD